MPELPEVTTIVRELNRWVRGKIIRAVTVDPKGKKLVRPLTAAQFRSVVRGKTFLGFRRRAKFVIAALGHSGRQLPAASRPSRRSGIRQPVTGYLVWHMGMTGHPLYRNPEQETRNKKLAEAMRDPMNQHARVTFHFTDGTRLEYTDIRMFGKVEVVRPRDLAGHPQLQRLGPEAPALASDPAAFCVRLKATKRPLKVALMDQSVVAGIGNIYADEILWAARLHPLRPTRRLTPAHCRALARATRQVLASAIRVAGTSIDDFRRVLGGKGRYGDLRKAYQRTGLPCRRCGTLMRRLVVGGRGTHVCPRCQVR